MNSVSSLALIGPPKHDDAGVFVQRFGQSVTQRRATDVEGEAAREKMMADPAGRRQFLMQDEQNRRRVTGGEILRGILPAGLFQHAGFCLRPICRFVLFHYRIATGFFRRTFMRR